MPAGEDWKAWRKLERARLKAARLALGEAARRDMAAAICRRLDAALALAPGAVVAVYWPFGGEPDLRAWAAGLVARGIVPALPVVTRKRAAMSFRPWHPHAPMQRDACNIPIPAGPATVTPDVAVAPLVGFDRACYRLGYGGGHFDRTLAALAVPPFAVGVGYAFAELPSIRPQPHDIAMRMIVTEQAVLRRG